MSMPSLVAILVQIQERGFWRALGPGLHIEELAAPEPLLRVGPELLLEIQNRLFTEGYFQMGPLIPAADCALLAATLGALWRQHVPLVFAYVYDELWRVTPWFQPFLAAVLGADFRQLPDLWGHHLDHTAHDAGWSPHRDKTIDTLLPNRAPRSLSLWIPLTDATPMNGCMYLLPANLDENFVRGELEKVTIARPQDIRALPARAGELLCWKQGVLHWGGRSSGRAAGPRISLALEYQRGGEEPFNTPLLDPAVTPTFEQRLALVAKQILQYRHMYDLSDDMAELAERLRDRLPLPGG